MGNVSGDWSEEAKRGVIANVVDLHASHNTWQPIPWNSQWYQYGTPELTAKSNEFKITYIYPEIEGTPPTLQGWQCPKCGRIYSPWKDGCWRCNNEVEEKEIMVNIDLEENNSK